MEYSRFVLWKYTPSLIKKNNSKEQHKQPTKKVRSITYRYDTEANQAHTVKRKRRNRHVARRAETDVDGAPGDPFTDRD